MTTDTQVPKAVDTSVEADAKRLRWLLDGNGYFLEERSLCGSGPCTEEEKNDARAEIDEAMKLNRYWEQRPENTF